ncbi:phage integrase central domain-containing protein [Bradyrhizobium sp. CCBAU 51745]|uniref:phage integrase central domain-containing protein n=1 Tax=Bradyrhizobium sp. CCBAU 51745 TaxID=1325099 RepID=UPI003FA41910
MSGFGAQIWSAPAHQRVLQRIEKSGRRETAHRLRGTLGTVFRYAVRTLRGPLDPTAAPRGALLKVEVTNRPAITDEVELGGLMLAIDEYDGWPTLPEASQPQLPRSGPDRPSATRQQTTIVLATR